MYSKYSFIFQSYYYLVPFTLVAATLLVYPGETRIEVDRSVSLTCVAMGHPLPSLTWLKDGVPLSSGDSFNITNTELSGTDSVTSILDICNIELSDTGLYGCEASNSLLADSLLEFQDSVQFNLSVLSELVSVICSVTVNVHYFQVFLCSLWSVWLSSCL